MARIIWREPKAEPRIDGEGGEKREVKHPAVRPIQKAFEEDKLEAKSRKDGAWYEAQLQLREKGVDVAFPLFPNDTELWTWGCFKALEPVSSFIRVLSAQLQDPDCSQVSVNMRVCALNESGKLRRYDDAIVTEVERRPHEVNGTEEFCTCIFIAKWQDGPLKGRTGKLQCDKICILSDKDVETHPTIAKFLEHCSGGRSSSQDPPTDEPKCKRSSIDSRHQDPPTDEPKCKTSSIDSPDDHRCDANGTRRFKRLKSKSTTVSPVKDEVLDFDAFFEAEVKPEMKSDSSRAELGSYSDERNVALSGRDSHQSHREESLGRNLTLPSRDSHQSHGEEAFGGNFTLPARDSLQSRGVQSLSRNCTLPARDSHQNRGQESLGGNFTLPTRDSHQKGVEESLGKNFNLPALDSHQRLGEETKSITLLSNADSKESADFISSLISPRSKSVSTSSSPDLTYGPRDIKPQKGFQDSAKPTSEKSMGIAFALQSVNDGKGSGVDHSGKEQPKHSSPCAVPIRTEQDVICLSDDEDAAAPQSSFSVISSPKDPGESRPETREKPQFSSKESLVSDFSVRAKRDEKQPQFSSKECLTSEFGVRAKRDEKQGWNIRPEDLARNRNTLSQKLTRSECVLVIDNLELGLQPGEVLEYLLKFLPPGKVHSVHIPPPYPGINRAVGYVVFFEKEAADSAAAFFGSVFVVSASGRPWVVTRQGQQVNENLVGFPTMSAFMGEVPEDDDKLSRDSLPSKLSVITEKQQREYIAAKQRMKLFLEHRRQIRVLFNRLAQEEEKLSANPEYSLYH